jgi:hypothetical protein
MKQGTQRHICFNADLSIHPYDANNQDSEMRLALGVSMLQKAYNSL